MFALDLDGNVDISRTTTTRSGAGGYLNLAKGGVTLTLTTVTPSRTLTVTAPSVIIRPKTMTYAILAPSI